MVSLHRFCFVGVYNGEVEFPNSSWTFSSRRNLCFSLLAGIACPYAYLGSTTTTAVLASSHQPPSSQERIYELSWIHPHSNLNMSLIPVKSVVLQHIQKAKHGFAKQKWLRENCMVSTAFCFGSSTSNQVGPAIAPRPSGQPSIPSLGQSSHLFSFHCQIRVKSNLKRQSTTWNGISFFCPALIMT